MKRGVLGQKILHADFYITCYALIRWLSNCISKLSLNILSGWTTIVISDVTKQKLLLSINSVVERPFLSRNSLFKQSL